jgi:DNA-binding transcriptional ArsR family regulator
MLRTINKDNKYEKGFFGMFNQGAKNVEGVQDYNPFIELANIKFGGETLRLFLFYIGIVEYDNKIKRYTQVEISEMIGMAAPNVSNANKKLLEAGIIYKDGRNYYFNDKYLVKGLKRYKRR